MQAAGHATALGVEVSGVNLACLRQRNQADHVDVGVGAGGPAADELDDKAGLANTAWTPDGQEASSLRQLLEMSKFGLATHERRIGRDQPDPVEQLMYGFSLICCLPDGRNAPESVATGTVMRPSTLERYATEAGFTGVEILPIGNDFFRFFRLTR